MFLSIWNTTSVISNYPTERNVSLRNIMRRILHLLTLLLFFKHIPLVQFYVLCFEFCVTTCYSYNSWIFVCVYVLFVYLLAGLAMLHNDYLHSVVRTVEKSYCTKTKEVNVLIIFCKRQLKIYV